MQSRRLLRRQRAELLVGESERGLLEGDLRSELAAVSAASAPAELLQPVFCGGESLLCAPSLPVNLALLLREESRAHLGVVERERLCGRALECARGAFRRAEPVVLACVRLVLELTLGEVKAGLPSRAATGDVSPFPEGAVVVEEDEGTLDGGPLSGVAGEGVAVLEVVGRVGERYEASRTFVGAKRERSLVEIDDRRARAVVDAEAMVVLATENAVADAELALPELEGLAAEAAGADQQRPGCFVEVGDVVALIGEHHGASQVVLGDLPPVFEHSLLGEGRAVGELETSGPRGVREVGVGIASAQPRERLPFGEVALTAFSARLIAPSCSQRAE